LQLVCQHLLLLLQSNGLLLLLLQLLECKGLLHPGLLLQQVF
jgi:hypothetical protein